MLEIILNRAIVSPRNETVNKINNLILHKAPGLVKTYKSIDTITNMEDTVHYPQGFLNALNTFALPPHELTLKIGTPTMLLQNLSPPSMCIGT